MTCDRNKNKDERERERIESVRNDGDSLGKGRG